MMMLLLPRLARGLACSVCLVAACPAIAALPTYSFNDTLARAGRAPSLQALGARERAAFEDARRAGRLPDPRLVVGLDNLPITGADAFDPSADDMTARRIGLMQDLPAPARRRAEQSLASRGVELAGVARLERSLEVREAAALVWLDVWSAHQSMEALAATRAQAGDAVQIARARLAGGTGSATDVMALQGAALDLDNRVDEALGSLEAAQASLARAVGAPTLVDIAGSAPAFDALPASADTLRADVDHLRPLTTWSAREALADSAIDAAVATKRPDWSVGAAYAQRSRGRSDMLMLEVSVGLPLRAATRQDRDIAARRAEREAVAAEHDQARLDAQAELETRLAQWEALGRQWQRLDREAVPLAHDRVDVAAAAYRGGGPVQAWLDARRELLERVVERSRLRGEYARAWARLAFLLTPAGGVR